MLETLFLMKIPALSARLSDVKIQYCDHKYDVFCGKRGDRWVFRASIRLKTTNVGIASRLYRRYYPSKLESFCNQMIKS